ncbi:hypothetical protein NPIL_472651 [Nephila pilipes]|uniref:Uncharacterized protein n=1 Tax=Nephila pilipes TaxID=299642 RepID=A0A8X6U9Z5_NEPPI|nr:hypothetical protein NPIL_472651 [Nephila pilipes]
MKFAASTYILLLWNPYNAIPPHSFRKRVPCGNLSEMTYIMISNDPKKDGLHPKPFRNAILVRLLVLDLLPTTFITFHLPNCTSQKSHRHYS